MSRGLDDSARQIAAQDPSIQGAVDMMLHLKNSGSDAFGQMTALTDLRKLVVPRVVEEQNWLLSTCTRAYIIRLNVFLGDI